MKKLSTQNQIIQDVTVGYDRIADKFANTRKFFWADLEFIQDLVKKEDSILDFGCGNGRLAGFLEGKYRSYLGADVSEKLLAIAKKNNPDPKNSFLLLGQGSGKLLFQAKNRFDVVLSLAVFHHLPGRDAQTKNAKILYDTVKEGGICVISVWNLLTPKYLKIFLKDKLSNRKNPKMSFRDFYLPFKTDNFVFERFLHIFTLGELRRLFEQAGFETIEIRKGEKNLIYVGKKL